MITGRAVFVLGAGASQPYGLPLGSELFKHVIDDFSGSLPLGDDFFSTTSFSRASLDSFVQKLHYSGFNSVDAFLERRPEFLDIGKAVIAIELPRKESHGNLWNVSKNWMKYLYDILLAGTETLEEFAERNDVSFITYNYDRSLEHFC